MTHWFEKQKQKQKKSVRKGRQKKQASQSEALAPRLSMRERRVGVGWGREGGRGLSFPGGSPQTVPSPVSPSWEQDFYLGMASFQSQASKESSQARSKTLVGQAGWEAGLPWGWQFGEYPGWLKWGRGAWGLPWKASGYINGFVISHPSF